MPKRFAISNHTACRSCDGHCCYVKLEDENPDVIVELTPEECNDPLFIEVAVSVDGRKGLPVNKVTGACIFFQRNQCGIYKQRPIRCRQYVCDRISDVSVD